MKHYKNLLIAVLLAVLSVSFVACGDDNESNEPNNPNPQALVETWECDLARAGVLAMDNIYESGEELMQFRADGTMVSVNAFTYTDEWAAIEKEKEDIEIEYDTWRVQGDKIINGSGESTSFKLKGNQLTITGDTPFGPMTLTFTRVNDSRIEKYLK